MVGDETILSFGKQSCSAVYASFFVGDILCLVSGNQEFPTFSSVIWKLKTSHKNAGANVEIPKMTSINFRQCF